MKDILLFGIQGSGKGTQARLLQEKFGFLPFATGEALRDHIERKTDIGERAAVYHDTGNLVPDGILIEILEDLFASIDQNKAIIFDGMPRTLVQKKAFDHIMRERKRDFAAIIIDLSTKEAMRRVTLRGETENRSDDQDVEVVNTRFANFREKTMPIVEEYGKTGTVVHINGDQSVERVHEDIVEALKKSEVL